MLLGMALGPTAFQTALLGDFPKAGEAWYLVPWVTH